MFRVLQRAAIAELVGADVVIWTTTPWTMPGNRAVAYGPEIDYALVHVERRRRGIAACRSASGCWWRCRCCRSFAKDAGHRRAFASSAF